MSPSTTTGSTFRQPSGCYLGNRSTHHNSRCRVSEKNLSMPNPGGQSGVKVFALGAFHSAVDGVSYSRGLARRKPLPNRRKHGRGSAESMQTIKLFCARLRQIRSYVSCAESSGTAKHCMKSSPLHSSTPVTPCSRFFYRSLVCNAPTFEVLIATVPRWHEQSNGEVTWVILVGGSDGLGMWRSIGRTFAHGRHFPFGSDRLSTSQHLSLAGFRA